MAEKPASADLDALKKIQDEIAKRKTKAKAEKEQFLDDIRECYSFMMPRRNLPGTSDMTRPQNATENFTTLGEEVCTDFASEMADTFIPDHLQWAGVEVGKIVPDELHEQAAKAAQRDTDIVFGAIEASNFSEAGKQGFKDLSISAFGLAITDPGAGEPFHCQPIPIDELLILRDVRGGIGTRMWVRMLTAEEIQDLLPGVTLPKKVREAKKTETHEFIQGCYRDHSKKGEQAWINFTTVVGEIVGTPVRKVGNGCASIQVARWDPDPKFAWGTGCGMKAQADFRQLDETEYLKLKGMARQVDPPVRYDDDSVINLNGGLPNGVAIPSLEGSKIDVIESRHTMEPAFYAVREVEDRIRRHFYLDEPRQEGKTPPTLGQWADESLRKQRRLGTPAAPLWGEFISEVYYRFRYLLGENGTLENSGIKVGDQVFPLRPVNPLKRAAQQEEAIASERVLGTLANTFGPEAIPMIIDAGKTAHNLVKLSRAENGIALRSEQEINAAFQQQQSAQFAEHAAKAIGSLPTDGAPA